MRSEELRPIIRTRAKRETEEKREDSAKHACGLHHSSPRDQRGNTSPFCRGNRHGDSPPCYGRTLLPMAAMIPQISRRSALKSLAGTAAAFSAASQLEVFA